MLEYFSADNPRYTPRKIADAAYEMEIRDHCFDCDIYFPLPNVWLGVSVENQAAAHKRIPMLLKTPAAARFISAEPLLGSVDLTEIRDRDEDVDCLWNPWPHITRSLIPTAWTSSPLRLMASRSSTG
jgi:hypothetical protein